MMNGSSYEERLACDPWSPLLGNLNTRRHELNEQYENVSLRTIRDTIGKKIRQWRAKVIGVAGFQTDGRRKRKCKIARL